jgi:hypothetical protein
MQLTTLHLQGRLDCVQLRSEPQLMRGPLGSSDQIPVFAERLDVGDLVTVFESGDVALFALVKAALDRAEIR